MVAVTLAVAVVSTGFLLAVAGVLSYLAFAAPSRDLPRGLEDEDASTAD